MEENKFNFSEEETNKAQSVEQSKEAVKQDAKGLFKSTKVFLIELLDFRHDTDRDATIDAIKNDIPFKGATAWILICSIFVASVGLNANSTAVVIGAMLISPLMGPILGVGLSIAINDIDTLKKSLINLATMIVLSLLTAFLFFYLFPLRDETSELLGRVKPDIRDVLIAFFGGLALIIARTKKGTIASVIFGVAIATALMPPLCTAGYGLAVGNWEYFGGAMYLFGINTTFIALATFLVLKVLRFPMLKYANSAKRKRIARFASLLAVIAMIPAGYTFWKVYNHSKFDNQIKLYVDNEVKTNNALQLMNFEDNYEEKTLELNFFNEISEATKQDLLNELKNNKNYPDLAEVALKIKGSDMKSYELISNAYQDTRDELKANKNIVLGLQKQIEELETEITTLNNQIETNNLQNGSLAFSNLSRDAKIRFSDLQYFSYANMLESSDFIRIDTLAVANVRWNASLSDSIVLLKEKELGDWLKQELQIDSVLVKHN